MGFFQHPHLTRGIVHTSRGAFIVKRGVVTMPDEVGEFLGWTPIPEDEAADKSPRAPATENRGDAS